MCNYYNLMAWLEVLKDLGIFTIAAGLIAFVFKSLYKQVLNKDIAKFKHALKQEQIKYSKLYDKRAGVIEKLYELLIDFDIKMGSLVSPAELVGDLPKKEKLKLAGSAGRKFVDYYAKKKIYFRKKIVDSLDEISKKFKSAWIDFTLFPITGSGNEKEKWEYWIKAWKTCSEKIPPLKEQLEDDFRKILGVQ